jgi:hypothetical protein
MRKVPGLRTKGYDLGNAIMDKDATQEEVYTKYGTYRGSRGVVVSDYKRCQTSILHTDTFPQNAMQVSRG